MQQSHKARLTLGRQHITDLCDDAALRVGTVPVHRVTTQETIVVIDCGDQVRTEQEVFRIQVAEDLSRLGHLFSYLRFNFRRGLHVQAQWTRYRTATGRSVSL